MLSVHRTPARFGRVCRLLFVLAASAPMAQARSGIRVSDPDKVILGQAGQCVKPAQVDYKKLQEATPEFRTIRDEGVEKGTARYELLVRKMTQRLREIIKDLAADKGYDCVVMKGSVKDPQGLTVVDITNEALEKLETDGGGPETAPETGLSATRTLGR